MSEPQQEYAFHPADLIDYAMDKPIGAARAALAVGLEEADVYANVIISELADNMELNQRLLKQLTAALRKDANRVIGEMPNRIKALQLERNLGL